MVTLTNLKLHFKMSPKPTGDVMVTMPIFYIQFLEPLVGVRGTTGFVWLFLMAGLKQNK